MSESEPLSAIDLFAGAGGLSCGLAHAGVNVLAAVEIHPDAARTCQTNHPQTEVVVADLRTLAPQQILAAASRRRRVPVDVGQLDLLVGGPPCQGFSFAGGKSPEDPRNELIGNFISLAGTLKPRVTVMENVPGLVEMSRYKGWMVDAIVKQFRDEGFDWVDYEILTAESYGVPQHRRRCIFVAAREPLNFSWPEPTHGVGKDLTPFVTVEDAISDLDFIDAGEIATEYFFPPLSGYQHEMRKGSLRLYNHHATRHSQRVIDRFALIPEGRGVDALPQDQRTKKDGLLRLSRVGISRAIVSAPEDLIHYRSHRIPTVRETARLQSFPDRFVFLGQRTSGNQNRRLKYCSQTQQVGNAVPPLLATAIGHALQRALGN